MGPLKNKKVLNPPHIVVLILIPRITIKAKKLLASQFPKGKSINFAKPTHELINRNIFFVVHFCPEIKK